MKHDKSSVCTRFLSFTRGWADIRRTNQYGFPKTQRREGKRRGGERRKGEGRVEEGRGGEERRQGSPSNSCRVESKWTLEKQCGDRTLREASTRKHKGQQTMSALSREHAN